MNPNQRKYCRLRAKSWIKRHSGQRPYLSVNELFSVARVNFAKSIDLTNNILTRQSYIAKAINREASWQMRAERQVSRMTARTNKLSNILMKRIRIMLAIGLATSLGRSVLMAEGTPKIEFDKTVFDFGKTSQVQTAAGTFTFKNTGDAVLKLEKPTTSCGCTIADLKSDTLQPGEKGELAFTLNLGTARANLEKHITVTSNDPKNPKVELTVKADYVPLYELVPSMARLDIRQGETTNMVVTLRRTDGKKLTIKKTEASNPWITIKADPAEKPDESSARISLTMKPEGAVRQVSESIRVYAEDTPQPSATLFLYGRVLGDIVLNPDMMFWSITNPETVKQDSAQAANTRKLIATASVPGKSFELRNIVCTLKELNVELIAKEKGKEYEIVARLAESPKESVRGTISVESNIPSQPKLEVPVTINVFKKL